MPEPAPTELRTVAFDWKDLVLFAASFVLVVLGLAAWEPQRLASTIVIILGVGAPLALRRLAFGWPALPPPKKGGAWSLLSMLGIFCALIGMLVAALGVSPLWHGRAVHGGVVGGGLGAVILASVLISARYPRSNLPAARAVPRQKE